MRAWPIPIISVGTTLSQSEGSVHAISAWKLAYVLKGWSPISLLKTVRIEWQPNSERKRVMMTKLRSTSQSGGHMLRLSLTLTRPGPSYLLESLAPKRTRMASHTSSSSSMSLLVSNNGHAFLTPCGSTVHSKHLADFSLASLSVISLLH